MSDGSAATVNATSSVTGTAYGGSTLVLTQKPATVSVTSDRRRHRPGRLTEADSSRSSGLDPVASRGRSPRVQGTFGTSGRRANASTN